MNIDPDWLIRMAEKENNKIVSAGGLVTDFDAEFDAAPDIPLSKEEIDNIVAFVTKGADVAKKNELTDDQVRQLAEELIDTSSNIYTVSKRLFGESVKNDRSTFDRLESVGEIFKCDECNRWQDKSLKSPNYLAPVCVECDKSEEE